MKGCWGRKPKVDSLISVQPAVPNRATSLFHQLLRHQSESAWENFVVHLRCAWEDLVVPVHPRCAWQDLVVPVHSRRAWEDLVVPVHPMRC